jgi:hypothetical protein
LPKLVFLVRKETIWHPCFWGYFDFEVAGHLVTFIRPCCDADVRMDRAGPVQQSPVGKNLVESKIYKYKIRVIYMAQCQFPERCFPKCRFPERLFPETSLVTFPRMMFPWVTFPRMWRFPECDVSPNVTLLQASFWG